MVEVFSGSATLSRCVRNAGYSACYGHTGLEGLCDLKATARMSGNMWQSAGSAFPSRLCALYLHYELASNPRASHKSNPPTTYQLRLLLSTILRCRPGAVVTFGLVCSSFVSVSRGSTKRHYFLPLGDETAPSVQRGNLLANRIVPGVRILHYLRIFVGLCVFSSMLCLVVCL